MSGGAAKVGRGGALLGAALLWALGPGCVGGGMNPLKIAEDSGPSAPGGSSTDPADTGRGGGGGSSDGGLECPDDECDGVCVNLDEDPRNCGACGRTCYAPDGVATCAGGSCVLAECASGTADCDADLLNGCETVSDCVDGGACTTSCGSVGLAGCADLCAPTCGLPAESCNAQDDDCDGECDEGGLSGCRASVYRSSGAHGHIYGRDAGEAAASGQTIESGEYFFVYAAEAPGLVPLYRCDKGSGRRFLTASPSCEIGLSVDLVVGYMATGPSCGAQPLYRLYSSATNNHFYTLSEAERDNAVAVYGYAYESIAGYVWAGR